MTASAPTRLALLGDPEPVLRWLNGYCPAWRRALFAWRRYTTMSGTTAHEAGGRINRWVPTDHRDNLPSVLTDYASRLAVKWIGLLVAWVIVTAVLSISHLGVLLVLIMAGLICYVVYAILRDTPRAGRRAAADRVTDRQADSSPAHLLAGLGPRPAGTLRQASGRTDPATLLPMAERSECGRIAEQKPAHWSLPPHRWRRRPWRLGPDRASTHRRRGGPW
jgi:hypothetical protein